MKATCIFLLLFMYVTPFTYSQTLDNKFADPLALRPAKIECIKILQDGKLLLGGEIKFFKNTRVNNLIRLANDSTLDETFSFPGNKEILILNVEVQSNGNIIVMAVGYNSQTGAYNGSYYLYQLNNNGEMMKEIDSFKNVSSIAIQTDDKILICGGYNGSDGYIKRLNSDMSEDPSFDNNIRFDNPVNCIAVNGTDLFAAGMFSSVNGLNKKSIIKLKLNGSLDQTFNVGTGTNDAINSLTIQNDGKILIGGSYINSFNGTNCHGLARLNQDGSVDTGITPPYFFGGLSKITMSGTNMFLAAPMNLNSVYGFYFLRLKYDGSIDQEFTPVFLDEYGSIEFGLAVKDDKLIFNNCSSQGSIYGLSECDFGGNLISSFSPEVQRIGVIRVGDYYNQKLLIAGDFFKVNGVMTYGLAKLDKDGTVDQSFLLKKNLGSVLQIKIMSTNDLLVTTGKKFFMLDNKAQNIANFNFQTFKTLYNVLKFRLLDDGKIFAGDCNNVYRLNPDGSEDPTFNIGTGIESVCSTFDFDKQDSKVIFGSDFDKFNGTDVNRIIRLNENGSPDNTFNTGTGPDAVVSLIKVLNSGEIIVGGNFTHFNGISIPNKIVKLSKNGAVDPVFISNQKASSFPGGINVLDAKVEQIDTMVYVKNVDNISLFNVNGKIYDFNLPVEVNLLNDIITTRDTTISGKKKSAGEAVPCMYAFGSFTSATLNPESIIKVILGQSRTVTGIKDNPDSDILIFPVPVRDKLYIQLPGLAPFTEISVISQDGRLIYSSKVNSAFSEIDMSQYSPGVYFVRIVQNGSSVITKKIIKH